MPHDPLELLQDIVDAAESPVQRARGLRLGNELATVSEYDMRRPTLRERSFVNFEGAPDDG